METGESHQIQCALGVRIIGFDIDGVLTDGRLWYGNDGAEAKAFHVHDGLGLKLLQQAGIVTVVISARASEAAQRRLAELGVTHVHLGVREKLPLFEQLIGAHGLTWYQAAYMGDDLPDLPILTRVVLPATVAEAVPAVRLHCRWQATRPAGAGAVREFAEFVLAAQGKLEGLVRTYVATAP